MNKALVALAFLYFVSLAFSANVEKGICHLKGTAGNTGITGTVTFTVNGATVTVAASISGIPTTGASQKGLHIHEYGDISSADGTAAGGHWNPAGALHACPPTVSRHAGDMGNWNVAANGQMDQTKDLDLITLNGDTTSIIGRGVVLHANTDDCVTNKTGNAGVRLATCVIGIFNPDTDNVNTAYNGALIPRAICVLSPTGTSGVTGTVVLQQDTGGTRVIAAINGITGSHGFHIHQFGDLSSPSATATGSHFDPLAVPHGIPPYPQRHVGDMGNIYYYNNGVAYYDLINDLIPLGGINSVIGRAIIVHNNTDTCSTQTGGAGSRLAQCVIGVMNPQNNLVIDANTPITQDISACEALYGTMATNADDSPAAVLSASLPLVFVSVFLGIFRFL